MGWEYERWSKSLVVDKEWRREADRSKAKETKKK